MFLLLHGCVGQVVANFSSSDLVLFPPDHNAFLSMQGITVQEYLTNSNGKYRTIAACMSSAGTFHSAARYMIDHHIHRLWIVDPLHESGLDRYGIGCVSLTDVIKVVNDHSLVYLEGDYVL